jgi:hypothetical protein
MQERKEAEKFFHKLFTTIQRKFKKNQMTLNEVEHVQYVF